MKSLKQNKLSKANSVSSSIGNTITDYVFIDDFGADFSMQESKMCKYLDNEGIFQINLSYMLKEVDK
jgi:hypothetical protein